uniref:Uncharacterized protein n=1 Tax=Cannabis sativa TaxID=3483 RepID=A0A803Q448_CANSA
MGIRAKELHHFILFPLMGQGHLIPMVDIARMLAERGVIITIFTTTQNAARFEGVLNRAKETGLRINLVQFNFPYVEAELPQGCESLDMLPSPELGEKMFCSTSLLQKPMEIMIPDLMPRPTCVIADPYLPWTINKTRKLSLEASDKPFIWVVRESKTNRYEELENWFKEYEFKERTKGRGVVIRGQAPQVLILSHPSIGAFLTHCGWNSTLEAISVGVPMVTWPLFANQLLNEKLVAQVLKIAVTLGSKYIEQGEEYRIMVKNETIKIAIEKVLDDQGEESIERRKRAKKLGEMGKRVVEESGSSHHNMTLFLEELGAKSY